MVGLFITLLKLLEYAIIADAVLSWIQPDKTHFPRSMTSEIADPLCAPFRKLIGPERTGGLDLSPIATLIVLQIMRSMLMQR